MSSTPKQQPTYSEVLEKEAAFDVEQVLQKESAVHALQVLAEEEAYTVKAERAAADKAL